MLDDTTLREMMRLGLTHLRTARACGIPLGPKHHLFVHLIVGSETCGHPQWYATFQVESLNRALAATSRSAYASVWEMRIFTHFASSSPQRRGAIE